MLCIALVKLFSSFVLVAMVNDIVIINAHLSASSGLLCSFLLSYRIICYFFLHFRKASISSLSFLSSTQTDTEVEVSKTPWLSFRKSCPPEVWRAFVQSGRHFTNFYRVNTINYYEPASSSLLQQVNILLIQGNLYFDQRLMELIIPVKSDSAK